MQQPRRHGRATLGSLPPGGGFRVRLCGVVRSEPNIAFLRQESNGEVTEALASAAS